MGQSYSVYVENLKVKENCESELIKAVHEFVKSSFISNDCKEVILQAQSLKDIVESVFGPDVKTREESDAEYEWDEYNDWHAAFSGSYGWEDVMDKTFRVMVPFLQEGSSLSVYPDYEGWHLIVGPDGAIVEETEKEEENIEELIEETFDSFEVILEDRDGDYSFGVQSNSLAECVRDACQQKESKKYAHIYIDGCKDGYENISLWTDGKWEDDDIVRRDIIKMNN